MLMVRYEIVVLTIRAGEDGQVTFPDKVRCACRSERTGFTWTCKLLVRTIHYSCLSDG